MRQNQQPFQKPADRRGSVLLAVLVIVAMLALGAYTFSEIMVTEAEGTAMFGRSVQARLFADSGIERALAVLAAGATDVDLYHNPDLFQNVLVRDSDRARGRGCFSVVAPVENDASAQSIRFGLIDESAKLNLNSLLSDSDADPDELRQRLMYLPNMTEEIADAILDWLDKDDEQRQFGAESDYYLTLDPPYEAKNGPMESLEELLLVAGVTPELLYGEDANRNGLLDPNEDDGDLSPPDDDADGTLDLGWSAYLTVYSRESNLRADGTEKINLNSSDLAELYDQIEAEFGEDAAKFVVAYRLYGPVQPEGQGEPSQGGVSEQAEQQARQAAQRLGRSLFGGGGQPQQVSRGGLDLSQGAKEKINSIFDLIGVEVQAEIEGQSTTLTSPWPDDPGQMPSYLPQLIDAFTTVDGPYREGRINVNQAREKVLMTVPGMTEELAQAIVGFQAVGSNGQPLTDTTGTRSTIGWLYIEGLATLEQLRELAPHLTARGSVYRAQVVGYYEEGGPFVRLEAVIDATELPPRIVSLQDLNDLGKGYSRSLLQEGLE